MREEDSGWERVSWGSLMGITRKKPTSMKAFPPSN